MLRKNDADLKGEKMLVLTNGEITFRCAIDREAAVRIDSYMTSSEYFKKVTNSSWQEVDSRIRLVGQGKHEYQIKESGNQHCPLMTKYADSEDEGVLHCHMSQAIESLDHQLLCDRKYLDDGSGEDRYWASINNYLESE